jgi:hypothetical protein
MSPLKHLADTATNLNAQFCELKELREQVRVAAAKQWNVPGTISRSFQK